MDEFGPTKDLYFEDYQQLKLLKISNHVLMTECDPTKDIKTMSVNDDCNPLRVKKRIKLHNMRMI